MRRRRSARAGASRRAAGSRSRRALTQPAGDSRLDAEGWFDRGVALARAELWEEAIACYDRALELEPRGAPGWLNKGVALTFLGRLERAIPCFEEAERLGLAQAAEAIALCRKKLAEKAPQGTAAPAAGGPAVVETAPVSRPAEIRVFVSSTFRDLQAEREELIKRVFPEVRRLCRERGVGLTEIDLRWGITDEESRRGKVLKICLDEVERCRPYFIGILGARYGWTPTLAEVERNRELLDAYPWVRDAAAAGRSATEMEIVHGVLGGRWPAEHSFFYIRDGGAQDDPDAAKLAALKERVRASGRPVREAADVETLGRLVYDDLVAVVEREYPIEGGFTPLVRERRAHEAFAASRADVYVADPNVMDGLDAHVDGEGVPLVVTGAPGSGKSALLAHWSARRRSDVFVVAHYAEADGAAADAVGVMRRVMEEIRARYDLDDAVPTAPNEIERDFSMWLARVREEKLVLVLDDVGRLGGKGRSLAWLPAPLPPGVRVIVSGVAEAPDDWRRIDVPLLRPELRDLLAATFLRRYGKTLDDEQRRRLVGRPQCANPLFLRTVLEELRVFGSFEELDARIEAYAKASELAELFQRVLDRLEDDFGEAFVREVTTLLWAARRGLGEHELLELGGRTRIELSPLLASLEYHLFRREGLLSFAHEHIREAARERYLANADREAAAHARLADYFEVQPASPRKSEELPWQLLRTQAWDRLRDCLGDLSDSSVLTLVGTEREHEVLGYWNALGERYDMVDTWRENLAAYEAGGHDPADVYARYNRVGLLLRLRGRYAAAAETIERALALAERACGPDDPEVATIAHNLALVRQAVGAYAEADALLRRALAIRERQGTHDRLELATSLNSLGVLLRARGDYAGAEPLLRRALDLRERLLGRDDPRTATVQGNLAALLGDTGRLTEADELFAAALETSEGALGPEHPDTARACTNLGALRRERGMSDAEPLLRRGLELCERAFGPNHLETAHALAGLAMLLYGRRDFGTAEALFQRALAVYEQTLGPEHPTTAGILDCLAGIHDDVGNLHEAEVLYRRALEVKERCLGDHGSTALTLSNLGYLLIKRDRLDDAEPLLERALAIRERMLGPAHVETAQSLTNLGGLHAARRDYDAAEPLLRHAVEIYEHALGPAHPETVAVRTNLDAVREWQTFLRSE